MFPLPRIYFNSSSEIDDVHQEYARQKIELHEKNQIIEKLNAKINKLELKIDEMKGVSIEYIFISGKNF